MSNSRRRAAWSARVSVVIALSLLAQTAPARIVVNEVAATSAAPIIATVVGTGTSGVSGDGGPATAATLRFVTGVAPTPDGGYLVAAYGAQCVRKVGPGMPGTATITTVAGTCTTADGTGGYAGDGLPATNAAVKLNFPISAIALTGTAFLFSDYENHCVRKVDLSGVLSTVAGQCGIVTGAAPSPGVPPSNLGDGGSATSATLNHPIGLALTANNGFLIADYGNACIRQVDSVGTITTLVGQCGTFGWNGDGLAGTATQTGGPAAVAVNPDGSFLFTDYYANRVRRAGVPDQLGRRAIQTVAGSGTPPPFIGNGTGTYDPADEGGQATVAHLNGSSGVALTGGGGFVIADSENNRVRYVAPDGTITTLVGTGPTGYLNGVSNFDNDNVPGDTAKIARPFGIAQRTDGSILIADEFNRRIRSLATRPATNSALPTITGTPQPRSQLTCAPGTWSGAPQFAYQWMQNGTPIPTATGPVIIVPDAAAGTNVACQVTAITAGGTSTATSAAVLIGQLATLTLSVPSGHGTIGVAGPNNQTISCPPTCAPTYPVGVGSDVFAVPDSGYSLGSWTGPCDPENFPHCSLTLNGNAQVAATFVPQPTLTIQVNGAGTVGDGGTITCASGTSCPFKVDAGYARFLTATPSPGQGVAAWTGCTNLLRDGTCAVIVNGDQSVTVTFGALATAPNTRTDPASVLPQNPSPAVPPRSVPGQPSPPPNPAPPPRSDAEPLEVFSVEQVSATATPVGSATPVPSAPSTPAASPSARQAKATGIPSAIGSTSAPQRNAGTSIQLETTIAGFGEIMVEWNPNSDPNGFLEDGCAPLPFADFADCHFSVTSPATLYIEQNATHVVGQVTGCDGGLKGYCIITTNAIVRATFVDRPQLVVSVSGDSQANATIVSLDTIPGIACTGTSNPVPPYGTGTCRGLVYEQEYITMSLAAINLTPVGSRLVFAWSGCAFPSASTSCVVNMIDYTTKLPMGRMITLRISPYAQS